jgi:uncharacterized protein YceK
MRSRPSSAPVPWRPRGGERPRGRRRLPLAVGVLAAMLGVAVLLGGCSSARSELGTSDSNCYVALPAAIEAVHHQGKLHGVLLVSVSDLRHRAPSLYKAATTRVGTKTVSQVCLVAFSGTFAASSLVRPVGRSSGHLAIVELDYPGNQVLATLLVPHVPLGFGHTHL